MRREFALAAEDARTLDASGLAWEAVQAAGMWIILHEHPVPPGYNVSSARVVVRMDTYPPGIIDMAYFNPPLSRADGKTINNLSPVLIDAMPYQQWSRHYAWTPGVDTLSSHLRRVRAWLKHELLKR